MPAITVDTSSSCPASPPLDPTTADRPVRR